MQNPFRLLRLLALGAILLAASRATLAAPSYGLNTLPTNRPISIGYLNSLRSAAEMNSFVWSGYDAVVHAFAEPLDSTGSIGEGLPNFLPNQTPLLTTAHAHGKAVLLSIGGADPSSLATQFNNIASNSTKRANFCQAVVSYLQSHGYDGVDIDWEFPSVPSGKANMTLLMQDLYAAVKAASPNYIVMFATGPGYWMGSYDFAALASVTDFYFYFGYDWTRPDAGYEIYQNGPIKNPGGIQYTSAGGVDQLPEASVRGGIQYALNQGFPPSKIICGLPFYGRHHSIYDSALFWSQARSTWAANIAYYDAHIDANSMEVFINTDWMTTPACMRMKMDALLKPATSALLTATQPIIRGIGTWQIGHEDVAYPDLSTAFASWLGAYSSKTVLTREAATGGGTQARLDFTAQPGGNYKVQYASALTTPTSWTTMAGTYTANAQGQFQVIDPSPLPAQRFYRAIIP